MELHLYLAELMPYGANAQCIKLAQHYSYEEELTLFQEEKTNTKKADVALEQLCSHLELKTQMH